MIYYLQNRILYPPFIATKPNTDLQMVVVIPAFNEPGILTTLKSLVNNKLSADCFIEVQVVLNFPENCTTEIKKSSLKTYKMVKQWMLENSTAQLKFYCLLADNLATKHAGVGLARKIGMDEAVQRFEAIGTNGLIVNLDADCTVSENYFAGIIAFFKKNVGLNAANIHYEHQIDNASANSGIILYELYLRYYVEALRYCKYPFAFHTVGSSFVVKSKTYQQQGGMNKRKAGEDFYFLHKIIQLGKFGEISEAVVYPSARESERVPFGTGRSILEWHNQQRDLTKSYNFKIFETIKHLFINPVFFLTQLNYVSELPEILQVYLKQINFNQNLEEIKSNTNRENAFIKRYYRFWNGFEVLKLVHYLRDHHFANSDLLGSCNKLLGLIDAQVKLKGKETAENLLLLYRQIQKKAL